MDLSQQMLHAASCVTAGFWVPRPSTVKGIHLLGIRSRSRRACGTPAWTSLSSPPGRNKRAGSGSAPGGGGPGGEVCVPGLPAATGSRSDAPAQSRSMGRPGLAVGGGHCSLTTAPRAPLGPLPPRLHPALSSPALSLALLSHHAPPAWPCLAASKVQDKHGCPDPRGQSTAPARGSKGCG